MDHPAALHPLAEPCGGATVLDCAFLRQQCCGDRGLEQELLHLFLSASRPLVAAIATMTAGTQDEVAHRLRGSSQGIGAWAMAEAARAVEQAPDDARPLAAAALAAAFDDVERMIRAHLPTP